jgi:3-oxoadipate enol-lactonase
MEAVVNGQRLAYDDVGNAEQLCLLLIHGFPLDRRMWQEQLVGLSQAARLIVPDLRGHGQSEVAPGPYTMEGHAEDLAALLDHLGIERAVVAGLSMGGYVAFALWRNYPQRVQGLVLLDTRAEADAPATRESREKGIAKAQHAGPAAIAEEMLPKLLAPESLEQEGLRETVLRIMNGQTAEGIIGSLQGLRDRADSTGTLPSITVPVLVIVGEKDAVTPPDVAAAMRQEIANAQVEVIPRAGHLSPLENPNAVNRAIRSFLRQIGEGVGHPDD